MFMKIYIASDHGGFKTKEELKNQIKGELFDLGPEQLEPSDDYPQFAFRVAEKVSQDPASIGFLFCRSGSGMVIAANKVTGIRAVDVYNQEIAQHAVSHNHANVFAFGADFQKKEEILACIDVILHTQPDQDPRHLRRIKQISDYEK
jgi:ribose 5-phosphate isomerase B